MQIVHHGVTVTTKAARKWSTARSLPTPTPVGGGGGSLLALAGGDSSLHLPQVPGAHSRLQNQCGSLLALAEAARIFLPSREVVKRPPSSCGCRWLNPASCESGTAPVEAVWIPHSSHWLLQKQQMAQP